MLSKRLFLLSLACVLSPLTSFAYDPIYKDYPTSSVPSAEDRQAPRYEKDKTFTADALEFIKEEKGQILVNDELMNQYLSPDTIKDIKSRPLEWLVVRNNAVDTQWRRENGSTVQYPVIVDFRYQQNQKNTGVKMNGTLQAVYIVTQENGKPSKVEFLQYNHSHKIEYVYTLSAHAEELMRKVLDDVLAKVYQIPVANVPR